MEDKIYGGYLVNSDFCGCHIKKEHAEFTIDVESHTAIFNFERPFVSDGKKGARCLFLNDSNDNMLTLLDVYCYEYSSTSCKMKFNTLLAGAHIEQLENIETTVLTFIIGSSPVPLLNSHLPQGTFLFDTRNVEVLIEHCADKSYVNDAELRIRSINGACNLEAL